MNSDKAIFDGRLDKRFEEYKQAGAPRNLFPTPAGDVLLLTLNDFNNLPDGTKVIGIFGETCIKGIDDIDNDTRAGYMAYGIPADQFV